MNTRVQNNTRPKLNVERLRAARGKRAITEIAAATSVTEQTVRNWEAGRSEPDASQLAAIAQLTGKPFEYFFRAA
jgi:transcriptional regulator with XRE-family HTH domain